MKKLVVATLAATMALCMFGCTSTKTVHEDWFTYEAPTKWGDPVEIAEGTYAYEPPDVYPFLSVATNNYRPLDGESSEEVFRSYFKNGNPADYEDAERFTIDGEPAIRGLLTYPNSDTTAYVIVFRTKQDSYVLMFAEIESEQDRDSINEMKDLSNSIRLTD